MIRHLVCCLLLLAASAAAVCQPQGPEVDSTDVPDGRIVSTEHYSGTSLWGYIDGGADLYLEYGFRQLTVQRIEIHSLRFTAEIYQMSDPEAAFGIFSVSRHKCFAIDSLGECSCASPHQVQAVRGTFYISITNEHGSDREQQLSIELARKIFARLNDEALDVPAAFRAPELLPYIRELQFVRGRLGLQNAMSEWESLFERARGFSLYRLVLEDDSCDFTLAVVSFDSSSQADRFFRNVGIAPNSSEIRTAIENERTRDVFPLTRRQAEIIEYGKVDQRWMNIVEKIRTMR